MQKICKEVANVISLLHSFLETFKHFLRFPLQVMGLYRILIVKILL